MTEKKPAPTNDEVPLIVNGQRLSPIQIQALREAAARRAEIELKDSTREVGGADRETNPTRYGDWEKAGRAVDFS